MNEKIVYKVFNFYIRIRQTSDVVVYRSPENHMLSDSVIIINWGSYLYPYSKGLFTSMTPVIPAFFRSAISLKWK